MHIPAAHIQNELFASNHMLRICIASTGTERQPTLVVKSTSLSLKYLIVRRSFQLVVGFLYPENHVMYGVRVPDDPEKPATIWSIAERQEELDALKLIAAGKLCHVALFNEASVNVCETDTTFSFGPSQLREEVDRASLCLGWKKFETRCEEMIEKLDMANQPTSTYWGHLTIPCDWSKVTNYYITNRLNASVLSLIDANEGTEQEELAVWFMDTLSLHGAVRGPQVAENSLTRELCDVLINYERGCFLVESKTLAVYDRNELPSRDKLQKNVEKNVKKALKQLKGAIRNVLVGNKVLDNQGREIEISREMPFHCIVLVPDLSLLHQSVDIVPSDLVDFMKETTGHFLHILDPLELFQSVRNAIHLSSMSEKTPPIMAFDVILINRFKAAIQSSTVDFRFLLKIETPA